MSFFGDSLKVIQQLSALDERTKELKISAKEIENKVGDLSSRVQTLEHNYANLASRIKLEILSEVRAEVTKVQTLLDVGGVAVVCATEEEVLSSSGAYATERRLNFSLLERPIVPRFQIARILEFRS